MAFRHLGGSPKQALPGEVLLVVHDFEARSTDELSLRKGERIELIERDDDFGDGWYLGKHVQNGKTGLFPEVYTTTTPRTNHVFHSNSSRPISPATGAKQSPTSNSTNGSKPTSPMEQAKPAAQAAQAAQAALASSINDHSGPAMTSPAPLNTTSSSQRRSSSPNVSKSPSASAATMPPQRSISMALASHRGVGEESPVMNETLSVIDEHITDLNTPRSSLLATDRRGASNSGSDYSSHIDHRLSYIAGNETDEEERDLHSRKEVLTWSPDLVAEYLNDIGVEPQHCEVFRDQEITGEVLLTMDQASVFLKEFDLGLVGRRLRTWHKIKAFQDEVRANDMLSNKATNDFSAQGSKEDLGISGLANGSSLSQTRNLNNESPTLAGRFSPSTRPTLPSPSPSTSPHLAQSHLIEANSTPASFSTFTSSPGPDSPRRPSAASVREFNHSRRHSAIDFSPSMKAEAIFAKNGIANPVRKSTAHQKAPSLDRNWTMGGNTPSANVRPMSAIIPMTPNAITPNKYSTPDPSSSGFGSMAFVAKDVDRGYVSGGEIESKRARNVLRKRDAASANHSRQSSNHEDHRRSMAGSRRHSRFGSVDSIRDTVAAMAAPAAKMYPGHSMMSRIRHSNVNDGEPSISSATNEITSPTVTKLDYDPKPRISLVTRNSSPRMRTNTSSNESPPMTSKSLHAAAKPRIGLRAISDAVTGSEKALSASPSSLPSSNKEPSIHSPTRTGSTTPSGASQNFDRESTDASSKGTSGAPTALTPTSGTTRRKAKKETSAYIRGLEQKTPQEQMMGCDYSGWMKKKSSNLMKAWKPRLFILRGRRLSYYYSEQDPQEKGLIDISFHRVLPADNDILTGLHATVTGAKSSPVSPSNAQTTTLAAAEAAAAPESTLQKSSGDHMFIFKLVPPRSGLSRAVNFTKPTVHYFAAENVVQGRLWMAALVKATIDRDETKPITTTYQQKTISLTKARAMRYRPPALMGLDEKQEGVGEGPKSDETGLHIQGVGVKYQRTGSLGGDPEPTSETPA